jgi:hypothetical protein
MNSDEFLPAILDQRWLHSHEEDTGGEMVFRPHSYPFGPSRGRTGFELKPDGSAFVLGPAPTDAPQEASGTWSVDDQNQLKLSGAGGDQVLKVVSSSPDKLVLKRS